MKFSRLNDSKPSKLMIFVSLGFILLFTLYSSNAEAKAISDSSLKKKYDQFIQDVAGRYGIDDQLIHSIILTESNYDAFAVSSKGAVGLMQLMPETAKDYGVKNLYDPYENIRGGVRYLAHLMNIYQNLELSLAAYNAGPEAVEKYGRIIPPYPETKKYVRKVKAFYLKNRSYRKRKSRIYKFYDESGKVVLTNNPHLYSVYKKRKSTG